MKEFFVNGNLIMVDDADAPLVESVKWHIGGAHPGYPGYVKGRIGGKLVSLHRVITQAPTGVHVDHINRNPLDNRRENLRFVSRSQNMANSRLHKNNKLGVRGVRLDKHGWYHTECKKNGIRYRKAFRDLETASTWVKEKLIELHGEYSSLDGCL